MAETQGPQHVEEKTFRSYTKEQGSSYAQVRRDYHPNLYKRIIDHHQATRGKLDIAVDVGCGPGQAARGLAGSFRTVLGFDPAESMVSTARELGGISASGEPISYHCTTAEALGEGMGVVANGSADLITAATAAHWFDMPAFWCRAAKLLKPGGTVAVWILSYKSVHEDTPNSEALDALFAKWEEEELTPYIIEGNRLARGLYAELPLPWDSVPAQAGFDRLSFVRTEWGTPDGIDAEEPGSEFYTISQEKVPMDLVEKMLGTSSPVTRWREAHPDKVNTEEDVVRRLRREAERLLHEAGVPEGQEYLRSKVQGALIMVKKI